jgi:hypothetical protein
VATGEEWEIGSSQVGAIAATVVETFLTVAAALATEEVEGTALATDKSRNHRTQPTAAHLVEHPLE